MEIGIYKFGNDKLKTFHHLVAEYFSNYTEAEISLLVFRRKKI